MSDLDSTNDRPEASSTDRRAVLRKVAAGSVAAWVAPMILTQRAAAAATPGQGTVQFTSVSCGFWPEATLQNTNPFAVDIVFSADQTELQTFTYVAFIDANDSFSREYYFPTGTTVTATWYEAVTPFVFPPTGPVLGTTSFVVPNCD